MRTLYWIQVIGNLSWFFVIFTIFFALMAGLLILSYASDYEVNNIYGKQTNPPRYLKTFILSAVICAIAAVFTPSTKQLYFIYGVGSVIEYAKENDTMKQLPDKAVEALDKWIDSISEEGGNEEKH